MNEENFLSAGISRLTNDTNFLVIGAMDGIRHDGLYPFISSHPEWHGIMVEPVKDQFERLKVNFSGFKNIKFENSAVTEKTGKAVITRVPIEFVGKHVPDWADGISTLKTDPIMTIHRYSEFTVKETVDTISIKDLIAKYNIIKVDLLQIDCEGYDYEIFNEFWSHGFRPKVIKIEKVFFSEEQTNHIISLLDQSGYTSRIISDDIVAFLP